MHVTVLMRSGEQVEFKGVRSYVSDDGELVIIQDRVVYGKGGAEVVEAEAIDNFTSEQWRSFESLNLAVGGLVETDQLFFLASENGCEVTIPYEDVKHTCTSGVIGSAYGCPACGLRTNVLDHVVS